MNSIIFFFYNLVIYPVMLFIIFLGSFFIPKIKKGLALRKATDGEAPWMKLKIKNPIWIHCASGEFEYAKALIREIKKQHPDEKILVTYFSPSYLSQIQNFELVDAYSPLPWDFPSEMADFFEEVQPKLILISRTDLWPQMLKTAKETKVKVILYSALISEKSSKVTNFLSRKVYSWILSFIDEIYCVTAKDKAVFDKLTSPNKVTVTGDTRFDQVFERLKNPKELKNIFNYSEKTLVCGSTWPQDEDVILKALPNLITQNIRVVVAPHEPSPSHLEKLESNLKKLNLKSVRYSQVTQWKPDEVLIVDTIGILADLYGKAQFAFIGGSFRKQIHSVMEALAYGCFTFFGPCYHNNREAIDFLGLEVASKMSVCFSFQTAKEFEEALLKRLNGNLSASRILIQNTVKQKAGASSRIVNHLYS